MKVKQSLQQQGKLAILSLLLVWLQCMAFITIGTGGEKKVNYKKTYTDTAAFAPNTAAGWHMYSSYFNIVEDSVDMELVLYRQAATNWDLPATTGTIAPPYAPSEQRLLDYREPNRRWAITLLPSGQCLLKLLEGPGPEAAAVMPVKVRYVR